MNVLRATRTGFAVLSRHVRNAGGRPHRLWWIARRVFELMRERRIGKLLARNAPPGDVEQAYAAWIARYDTLDDAGRARLRATLGGLAPRASFTLALNRTGTPEQRAATIASLDAQLYPHWRLVESAAHADARAAAVLAAGNGADSTEQASRAAEPAAHARHDGYVALLAPGDRLAEDALLRIAQALAAQPATRIVYADHDEVDAQGRRRRPFFKPDWNPEWFRTRDYVGAACFVAADVARALDPLPGTSAPACAWDWRAQAFDAAGEAAVAHVPRILCHCAPDAAEQGREAEREARSVIERTLARNGVDAGVERSERGWRIRYRLPSPPPRVSIVVPTRDRAALLARCVDSIAERTRYPDYEIVVVDNDSREPAALRLIDALAASGRARVVRFAAPFNFSAECNAGVAAATGDVAILLNNDTEVVDADWLETLASHAIQPGVAFVGALLLYPDRTIQHAGVVVGLNGIGEHRFRGRRVDDPFVAPWIAEAQNVSAVSAACAAVRRDTFTALGGFDESLAVANNDVDICLRALARGFRNVWTPHARLVHHESASRGYENSPAERVRLARESAIVRARWGGLLSDDPAYNANLTLDGPAYGLAFPPRREL